MAEVEWYQIWPAYSWINFVFGGAMLITGLVRLNSHTFKNTPTSLLLGMVIAMGVVGVSEWLATSLIFYPGGYNDYWTVINTTMWCLLLNAQLYFAYHV